MMKYIFGYIIVVFLALSVFSCRYVEDENHHYFIRIGNHSRQAVYFACSSNYPDTTTYEFGVLFSPQIYKTLPGEVNTSALENRNTWEFMFSSEYRFSPHDTLMIFVFDAKKLEVKNDHVDNAFLMRYDVSLQDLQRVNWYLTYPPNISMKAIKMWPRYGE